MSPSSSNLQSPRVDPSPPVASTAAIASATAHALNNLLSTLYAASGFLEEAKEPIARRADAAIARAMATGKALSCAMYLLSLEENDIQAMRATPACLARCDADTLVRLSRLLQDTARVELLDETGGQVADMTLSLDTDTFEALLVCTAFIERRESGGDMPLVARLLPPAADAALAIRVLFQGQARLTGPGGARAHSLHPCSLALGHARSVLRALSVNIVDRGTEDILIGIPAAIDPPA